MKKQIKLFLGILALTVTSFLFQHSSAEAQEVTVCPGSGEKCKVTQNGFGIPFDSKGKDDSAIVIVL
jgi:hypothetical protein